MLLFDKNEDKLKRHGFFLALISFWNFETLSEDASKPDGERERSVKTSSITDPFISCSTLFAKYLAMGAVAAFSLSIAIANYADNFGAVAAWVLAAFKDSSLPDE